MYQAIHTVWCAFIKYLDCLLKEKRLFTCLAHPAPTLASMIKTLHYARRKANGPG